MISKAISSIYKLISLIGLPYNHNTQISIAMVTTEVVPHIPARSHQNPSPQRGDNAELAGSRERQCSRAC